MGLQYVAAGTSLAASGHRKWHGYPTEVRYASPDGDNANDGLTWGTAKKDIVSAYDALPSTGGTIFVGDGTFCDSVNTNRGLWIIGPNDPSAGSPPTGFRGQKRLNLVGAGLGSHPGNGHGLTSGIAGGSSTDRTRPAIWVTGNNVPITFANLKMAAYAVAVRLGMRADGTNATTNTSGIVFRNCGFELHQIAGNGPAVELGYVFWLWFHDCVFGGNASGKYTLTAASITSGTTARFTTSITHALVPGDTVYVQNMTPSGYNGTWTITAVAATTFDADIGTSPGAGSAFGDATPVRSYRRAAIGHDTVDRISGGTPSGLIHLENCNFNGGGFHYAPSSAISSGRVNIRNMTYEGAFGSDPHPPALHVRAANGAGAMPTACFGIHVENVELADGVFPDGAVLVDGVGTDPDTVTVVDASVTGTATAIGGLASSRRQVAINAAGLWGHSPAAARSFGAASVPFTNLAPQDASTWGSKPGSATVTTAKPAPDGSTLAARFSSGSNAEREIYRAGVTFAVGDWVIAGVWRRLQSGSTSDNNRPLVGSSNTSVDFDIVGGSNIFVLRGPITSFDDDGGWCWFTQGGKVMVGGAGDLLMSLRVAAGSEVDYYAPVLIRIPAASVVDDDDVRDVIRYLRTFPDGVPAGAVSTFLGQDLYAQSNIVLPKNGAYIELQENSTTDAAAPAADHARLYLKDNGAGKEQLVVRFATGAVQVLATEP